MECKISTISRLLVVCVIQAIRRNYNLAEIGACCYFSCHVEFHHFLLASPYAYWKNCQVVKSVSIVVLHNAAYYAVAALSGVPNKHSAFVCREIKKNAATA